MAVVGEATPVGDLGQRRASSQNELGRAAHRRNLPVLAQRDAERTAESSRQVDGMDARARGQVADRFSMTGWFGGYRTTFTWKVPVSRSNRTGRPTGPPPSFA